MAGRRFCYWLVIFSGTLLAIAANSQAGWISEISRLPRAVNPLPTQLPAYVELSNMHGHPQAELIVIDARDNLFHGLVLNVHPIDHTLAPPAQVPAMQVVADNTWPAPVFPGLEPLVITQTASPLFDFSARHSFSVILVAGTSHLAAGNDLDRPDQLPAGATLLDAVTFTVGAQSARPFAGEVVIDAANAVAIARTQLPGNVPADAFLTGMTDPTGRLIDIVPGYHLDPGVVNAIWPPHTPEPSVLAIMLAAGLAASTRRRRR